MKFRRGFVQLALGSLGFVCLPEPVWCQDCNMTGKQLLSRVHTCASDREFGCTIARTNLVFVGDKLIEYDSNPDQGTIYYIGRTVEMTDKDVPSARIVVLENGFASARVSLTATMTGGQLRMSRKQNFFDDRGQMVSEALEIVEIQINNCASCRTVSFATHIKGSGGEVIYKMLREESCEITQSGFN